MLRNLFRFFNKPSRVAVDARALCTNGQPPSVYNSLSNNDLRQLKEHYELRLEQYRQYKDDLPDYYRHFDGDQARQALYDVLEVLEQRKLTTKGENNEPIFTYKK